MWTGVGQDGAEARRAWRIGARLVRRQYDEGRSRLDACALAVLTVGSAAWRNSITSAMMKEATWLFGVNRGKQCKARLDVRASHRYREEGCAGSVGEQIGEIRQTSASLWDFETRDALRECVEPKAQGCSLT